MQIHKHCRIWISDPVTQYSHTGAWSYFQLIYKESLSPLKGYVCIFHLSPSLPVLPAPGPVLAYLMNATSTVVSGIWVWGLCSHYYENYLFSYYFLLGLNCAFGERNSQLSKGRRDGFSCYNELDQLSPRFWIWYSKNYFLERKDRKVENWGARKGSCGKWK